MSRNHYDVLGIRPNAGRDEIELAYKGRRSQYHPDRYAQADAETQAWATRCMQEVNAAYAALINGGPSATKPETPPKPNVNAKAHAHSTGKAQSLADVLRAHPISKRAMERIHIAPNIPLKKLHNALESYNSTKKPGDVIALVDDTVFGGGKDGLLLTEDYLLVKEPFQLCRMIPLNDREFNVRKKMLYADTVSVRDFHIVDIGDLREFVQALNESMKRRTVAQEAPRSSAGNVPGIEQLLRHMVQDYLGSVYEIAEQEMTRAFQDDDAGDGLRDAGEAGLIVHAIRLTGELPRIVERANGRQPSDTDRACLLSDAVRVELLLYQTCWAMATLGERYGRNRSDLKRDLDGYMSVVLAPTLAILQDYAMPDIERASAALMGTPFQAAVDRRMARHLAFFAEPSADHGVHLYTCLADPVALHARSVEIAPGMGRAWAKTVSDACSPADVRRLVEAIHQYLGASLQAYRGYVG